MKRRKRTKRNRSMRVIRLWTRPDALKALPYFRSITSSLRDQWLEVQSKRLEHQRLGQISRPNRSELIALDDTESAQDKAEDAFNESLEELMRMDVFLLDPVHGLALIPFQQEDELAWYVFDLHEEAGLSSWRFHKDPIEMRRALPEDAKLPAEAAK